MATATVQAQKAPTASEMVHMHWATAEQCVAFHASHPDAPAYVPATPYPDPKKKLKAGEEILPLPWDAEGCYKQPLPGGVHGWVIRLKDDPTVYDAEATDRADGRCFNLLEERVLFHTTPAAPAPAATNPAPTPTTDRDLEFRLAMELVHRENCSNTGKLLQQAQYDRRKKNVRVKVQYDMNGCVAEVSDDNFKPAGSGFMAGFGRVVGSLFVPPVCETDMYGRCIPAYGYGYGHQQNVNWGHGGGHHGGGGGGHNTGGSGNAGTGGHH